MAGRRGPSGKASRVWKRGHGSLGAARGEGHWTGWSAHAGEHLAEPGLGGTFVTTGGRLLDLSFFHPQEGLPLAPCKDCPAVPGGDGAAKLSSPIALTCSAPSLQPISPLTRGSRPDSVASTECVQQGVSKPRHLGPSQVPDLVVPQHCQE